MTALGKCYGSLKTLNISPYIVEQLVSPTVALPTAMPASPQFSVTLDTTTMAPTMSGVKVLSWLPVFGIFMSAQNTSGASATINYQINKNGVNYKAGSTSVANTNYFTASLVGLASNGDKFDFYLWTSATSGVVYNDQGYFVLPSNVDTGAKYIANAYFTADSVLPHLTATGHAGNQWGGAIYLYITDKVYGSGAGYGYLSFSGPPGGITGITFPFLHVGTSNKFFVLQAGTGAVSGMGASSVYYPQIYHNFFPSQIQYRDLHLG